MWDRCVATAVGTSGPLSATEAPPGSPPHGVSTDREPPVDTTGARWRSWEPARAGSHSPRARGMSSAAVSETNPSGVLPSEARQGSRGPARAGAQRRAGTSLGARGWGGRGCGGRDAERGRTVDPSPATDTAATERSDWANRTASRGWSSGLGRSDAESVPTFDDRSTVAPHPSTHHITAPNRRMRSVPAA